MRTRLLLLLVVAAAVSLGLVARSRADGPSGLMLIGRGASGGVQWADRARANGTHITTELTLREGGGAPSSTFSDAHLSASDPVAWSAEHDVGPNEQQLLDGTAYATVDHLRLEFADGSVRQISPSSAPRAARSKWPALAHFRFFTLVLPQQPAMMGLVAIDRRGRTIERIPLPQPALSQSS